MRERSPECGLNYCIEPSWKWLIDENVDEVEAGWMIVGRI